jgi:hypothetical protein
MKAMTRHEQNFGVRAVPRYDLDTLGAPFKVTLIDGVILKTEGKKEIVEIPDLGGLINTVVRVRVCHLRKLTGQEIKFVRRALGLRSKDVAKFLGMSLEHYSRCESEAKVMSATNEKFFRLFAFVATHTRNPSESLSQADDPTALKENIAEPDQMLEGLFKLFFRMKIKPVFNPDEKLHFEFVWRARSEPVGEPDDGVWEEEPARAA